MPFPIFWGSILVAPSSPQLIGNCILLSECGGHSFAHKVIIEVSDSSLTLLKHSFKHSKADRHTRPTQE
eukprot:3859788-Amphidinium_carterae.1